MREEKKRIGEERKRWEKEILGEREKGLKLSTTAGFEVEAVHSPEESEEKDFLEEIGFPGSSHSPGVSIQICIAADSGRCANIPAWLPPRNRMRGISFF